MDLLVAAAGFAILGTITGSITGLIPGIHVNTIAVWAISAQGSFSVMVSCWTGLSPSDGLIVLVIFLVSAMISHEFTEIIPSVFLGAPDPDSSLTVYPGHRLLRRGLGYMAIVSSAAGTVMGALFAILLIVPLRALMGPPLNGYNLVEPFIPYILILIVFFIIMCERKTALGRGWRARVTALGVFMLSGAFGVIVLGSRGLEIRSEDTLFPIFTGLFGVSTLIFSLRGKGGRIPRQKTPTLTQTLNTVKFGKKRSLKTIISALSGSLVSFFPGVTGAQATSVANLLTGGDASKPESYIHHISVIKISASIFSIMALFTIMKGRSGVAVAISHIVPSLETWSSIIEPPRVLILILFSMLISTLVSFFVLTSAGLIIARNIHKVNPGPLAIAVIIFLLIMVLIFTGLNGLLILGVATSIGLLTQTLGVSRVHLMGVLILPVIIYYLAI